MKKQLIFSDDKSNKFWNIEVSKKSFTVTYGKIGTAGTSATKTFESDEKCLKEAEKVIAEKLKKGYTEAGNNENKSVPNQPSSNYLEKWQSIVSSKKPAEAVYKHLEEFLTQSDECKTILKKLMLNFIEVKISGERLEITFKSQYKDNYTVRLAPPYLEKVDKKFPSSFVNLLKYHNGISFNGGRGPGFGFGGFENEDGDVYFNGSSFENEALEEGDNEDFLDALDNKGLSVDDVISPIDYGQNWIIWNPIKKNKKGEPQLCFVSHESCEVEPIKKAGDLFFGPVFLRIMYKNIVDYKSTVLDAVYN